MVRNSAIRTRNLPTAVRAGVIRAVFDEVGASEIVAGYRGAARGRGLIYFMRGNLACVRPYRLPRDPHTGDQIQWREWWGQAQGRWSEITDSQRAAWGDYAMLHRKALGVRGSDASVGRNVFVKVRLLRFPMGIVSNDAPILGVPPRPVKIIQEAASSDSEIAFRLMHSVASPAGMWILIEQTPPTLRPTRKPRENDLRWICGNSMASFMALQASGGLYTVTNVRYPIGAGERYGMRVRVVTSEGVAGEPAMGDFIYSPHNDAR